VTGEGFCVFVESNDPAITIKDENRQGILKDRGRKGKVVVHRQNGGWGIVCVSRRKEPAVRYPISTIEVGKNCSWSDGGILSSWLPERIIVRVELPYYTICLKTCSSLGFEVCSLVAF
jgi:hypothetical protein